MPTKKVMLPVGLPHYSNPPQHKHKTMNQILSEVWPFILTAGLSVLISYVGGIQKMQVKMAVLEQEVNNLRKRTDKHSETTDNILEAINDVKSNVSKQLTDISLDLTRIRTTLSIMDKIKDMDAHQIK